MSLWNMEPTGHFRTEPPAARQDLQSRPLHTPTEFRGWGMLEGC